jgi:hypothetical protein
MDNAWVGVVGAMVGAVASYPLQALHARRSDEFTRSQHLRTERVVAYSNFAEKMMDWRRSQNVRKKHDLGATPLESPDAVISDENQRVRASAWSAYYQVKLLCGDEHIDGLAKAALDSVEEMKNARTLQQVQDAGDEVRAKLHTFLEAASRQTTATN